MRTGVKVLAACMVAVMLMSCAGRRARQAEERQRMMEMNQPGCTAQAVGACPSCNVRCPVGQSALCKQGELAGNQCAVQPSCRCGPQS